jgi:hypothetical protein
MASAYTAFHRFARTFVNNAMNLPAASGAAPMRDRKTALPGAFRLVPHGYCWDDNASSQWGHFLRLTPHGMGRAFVTL